MECQPTDSKKVFQVFNASSRKKSKKRQGRLDDSNSAVTDGSNYSGGISRDKGRASSAKASVQDIANAEAIEIALEKKSSKRNDSSPERPEGDNHRQSSHSPRRSRRPGREGVSLALKAGLVSTPRSQSPRQDGDAIESIPRDQDSFIYAFLEDAIKRDKKKQRHSKRHEQKSCDRDRDRERDREQSKERRHRRKHRDEVPSQEHKHHKEDFSYRHRKEESPNPLMDQAMLFETFAKFCTQMSDKTPLVQEKVTRSQSHKSLQCEVEVRNDSYDIDQRPVRLNNNKQSRENVALSSSRNRSPQSFRGRVRSHENIPVSHEKYGCCYDKPLGNYSSKLDVRSRVREIEGDRYRDYPPVDTRSRIDTRESRHRLDYNYRDDERRDLREKHYDERKRPHDYLKPHEKASRSFDVNREVYEDDRYRRTNRSDKDKRFEEFRDIKRYDDRDREKKYMDMHRDRYYEDRQYAAKDKRRPRRLYDSRFERNSIGSRDDVDRLSERERDSGLSVADENSTLSGRSNYLRVVKQEIAEQRESMDKMMKLWKELMKCFKGISQPQDLNNKPNADNVRDSAAAQLRLWRECMRRYETVARDVGDTDARLMEEINKQRSEMAEMANMWQECLQRYREMSNDFISLKQQLASESPTRQPAPPPACAEGEGSAPPASPHYRMPPGYPPPPLPGPYGAGPPGHPPLRPRASAPWEWWCNRPEQEPRRRQSSPESVRGSRDRDQRRKHRDRDDSRYKAKPTKPTAARSDHRHRKR